MKTKANQQNTFIRVITSPYRAFCRARDFYVNSMIQCATGNAVGMRGASAIHAPDLPRSFSVNSVRSEDSEDCRELIRAASARNGKIGLTADSKMAARPPRSVSAGMGRIDEDKPCSNFIEEILDVNVKKELKYSRSKSHAVARTSF